MSRRASSFMLGEGTVEFMPEQEAKLDEEWGISTIGGGGRDCYEDMTGVGLRQFPSTGSSGNLANLLRGKEEEEDDEIERRRKRERTETGPFSEDDVELEVLETKSMPDLDHRRKLSFAASILDELDGRLQGKTTTTLSPEEEEAAKERAEEIVKSREEGPRIRVIERRNRSRSLTSNVVLGSPLLPDVPTLASNLEDLVETGTVSGKAKSDSLFARPSSALAFTSRPRERESSFLSRTSDYLAPSSSNGAPIDSSTSPNPALAPSSRFRSTTHDTARTGASSSLGDYDDQTRPPSALSMTPSVFTSRFDPNIIRQQREEQLLERPNFSNLDAGKPPNVILMPAPLAGQPLLPPKKPRKEGPSGESSEDEEEESEEEEEEEEEPAKPQRPAGALYGRSLMDIMEERKALLKAQQRAYVPGSDGRRTMMDWKDSPAAVAQAQTQLQTQESIAAQGALAKLEGRAQAEDSEEREEEVPLALLPAGGAIRRKPKNNNEAISKSRSGLSIFGPDMLYQRELAAARKLEEEERLEREEIERREKEVEEQRRIKEERRRLKKKMGSKALQYRDLVDQQLVSGEFKTPGDLLRESQRASMAPEAMVNERLHDTRSHGPAPSISIPNGLSNSTSDWFEPLKDKTVPEPDQDQDDDEEDPRYRPRTLSGELLQQHRKSGFLDSDSEEEEEGDETFAQPTPRRFVSESDKSSPNVRRLALPGEPSSQGHGETEEDEDEDEVPLGRRYSRHSLMLSPSNLPALELDLPTNEPLATFPDAQRLEDEEDEEDEDEVPLGRRYSRAVDPDEDDVPLAIRRMSLAPSAVVATPYSARFEPRATITALDENENEAEVVQVEPNLASKSDTGDSDDLPLGLKQQPLHNPMMLPNYGVPQLPPPHPFYAFGPPPTSQFFAPAPMMPPHDPSMTLALAQMQMQAALMSQGGGAGPGEGIENWRRGVQS
ncbi:uncharacterized protein JCM6883_005210 [Sporobolomyces salmoneus]|uniref:uncharacterized protein n=1 Tax=Sporobolomyces salmoneus TaxID=183962 RepID=UPI00317B5509